MADPKLLSVIGTSCSSAALGVADTIFSKKGILLVSPSNTGPSLTAEGQHQPFYLRTAHNDKIQGAVVADFATNKLKAKTAATIHDESPYSDGLAAVFRQVFEKQGGKITNDEAVQSTDPHMKPVLNSISQNKPDFIYYLAFNPVCALIAKQGRAIPALTDTALMGSDGCAAPEYVKVGGKSVYGSWSSSPDQSAQAEKNPFYSEQFLPAYKQQFGESLISVFMPTATTPSTSWPRGSAGRHRRRRHRHHPADQAQGRGLQDQQLQGPERDAHLHPAGRLRHGRVDRRLQGPGLAHRGGHPERQAGVHRDQDAAGGLLRGGGKMRPGASVTTPRRSACRG